ncbi:LytTR family DNA-binding domain-containing protein [Maricaulis salignorans]|uniref:LytTr DNA-binding domain-containing protein n=1 Tax=Maricaulis salignorans TaxID=144026 RepID=A0A1G9LJ63_9PROT|nr:LytTR family DNA-binding domain-containing protein [Maricaulis salignorans]SDL61877.1 LytTr DNA-binding domain-containing protein [Maricaulis salignorans]
MTPNDSNKGLLPTIAIIVVLGSFLSVLGPYQTHQLGFPGVWFYWVGLMSLGWASNALVTLFLARLTGDWPCLAHYALASFLISIPITIGVVTIQALLSHPFAVQALPVVFIFVWVISAAVTALGWLMDRRAAPPETPAISRALLDKLPPRLQRAPLLALQSEDHYLRVHTSAGDALVLMRLSDAMTAVENLDGRQTHRSWWVARQAVDTVSRGDGRAVLTLSNGVQAPVSRTHAPGLREAGWY